MPTYRATMLMQQGNAGWSESFYRDGASAANVCTDLSNYLGQIRRRLLVPTAAMIGYRAQNVVAAGDALVRSVNEVGLSTHTADTPYQSLLLSLRSADFLRRVYLLRGLPDEDMTSGLFLAVGAFGGNLATYAGALQSGLWKVRRTDRTNLPKAIVSVSAGGLVTFFEAHGIPDGGSLKFLRTRDIAGHAVQGTFGVVTSPTPLTLQLASWTGQTINRGTVRRQAYVYSPIESVVNTGKVVSRRVGRPFGSPVGRRRKPR